MVSPCFSLVMFSGPLSPLVDELPDPLVSGGLEGPSTATPVSSLSPSPSASSSEAPTPSPSPLESLPSAGVVYSCGSASEPSCGPLVESLEVLGVGVALLLLVSIVCMFLLMRR